MGILKALSMFDWISPTMVQTNAQARGLQPLRVSGNIGDVERTLRRHGVRVGPSYYVGEDLIVMVSDARRAARILEGRSR